VGIAHLLYLDLRIHKRKRYSNLDAEEVVNAETIDCIRHLLKIGSMAGLAYPTVVLEMSMASSFSLLPSSFFLLPSSFFLLPSSFWYNKNIAFR
jgi:hypothetical protein